MEGLTLGQFIAISAASAGASATAAVVAARAQNQAVEESAAVARKNQLLKSEAARKSAAVETLKTINEAQLIQGRIRVATAEMGTAISPTSEALQFQAALSAQTDVGIIQQNLAGSLSGYRSGAEARIAQLRGQATNPLIAGVQGGVQGGIAGLQLASGIDAAGRADKT